MLLVKTYIHCNLEFEFSLILNSQNTPYPLWLPICAPRMSLATFDPSASLAFKSKRNAGVTRDRCYPWQTEKYALPTLRLRLRTCCDEGGVHWNLSKLYGPWCRIYLLLFITRPLPPFKSNDKVDANRVQTSKRIYWEEHNRNPQSVKLGNLRRLRPCAQF